MTNTLKDKEAELQNLKEQHAHLLKLSKDRSLPERETLTKHVNELQKTVDNQSNTIQVSAVLTSNHHNISGVARSFL